LARGFSQIPGLFFNILPNQRWKTPLKESASDDTILKNNFPEYATFSASHTFYWQKYFYGEALDQSARADSERFFTR
jgi:hypothetical protein